MRAMYSGQRVALFVLCGAFVGDGLIIASIGPILPELARQTGRSLAEMGTLFIAQFGGGLLAQVLAGRASDRWGRRVVLIIAGLLFSFSAVAMTVSTRLSAMLAFMTMLGIGFGGVGLAVNILASELTPHRRAATLNLVNLFYAVGAIAGPLLAGRMLVWTGSARPAMWIGAALLLALMPVAMRVTLPAMATRETRSDAETSHGAQIPPHFIWTSGVLLLLYIGSEAAVGGWTPTYLARSTGVDAARAATLTSVFWISLCAGRGLGTLGGLHLPAGRLLSLSLALAVAGAITLTAAHGLLAPTIVALVLLGLAFGPIYPTVVAIITARYQHAAGAAMSRLGSVAQLGGMVLPAIFGWLMTHAGTVSGAWLLLGVAVAMAALWMVIDPGRSGRPGV